MSSLFIYSNQSRSQIRTLFHCSAQVSQSTCPILCRNAEALEKVQKRVLKFVKGLRHVPYEAALDQLRLFSLTRRRICGDLIAMFKITHDLLEFPMASTFAYPTRQGLREVPRSTHLTHLLQQPIPLAHIDPRKNSHPNDPSHIPTPPPGRV